jgi:hypothetical protein
VTKYIRAPVITMPPDCNYCGREIHYYKKRGQRGSKEEILRGRFCTLRCASMFAVDIVERMIEEPPIKFPEVG